jgi:hypothetical protein
MHISKLLSNINIAKNNFKIALFYDKQNHYSAAACFYLRCADRSKGKIRYESLIKAAICYDNLKSRNYTQEILLKQAICELPQRPEAYFLICQLYEKNKDWINCYIFSELALLNCKEPKYKLINYSGMFHIKIYNAISCWWLGKADKSLELFIDILQTNQLCEFFKTKIEYYLIQLFYNQNHPEEINSSIK